MTCLSTPCGSKVRFIELFDKHEQLSGTLKYCTHTYYDKIMRDCRSSVELQKWLLHSPQVWPHLASGRIFICSTGVLHSQLGSPWPKGPRAESIMDGFDASLGGFQVLLQVFAASIQQLEQPGSWNSRRPCLEAVLGWCWSLLGLQ